VQTSSTEPSSSGSDWIEITSVQLRELVKKESVVPVVDIRLRSEYRLFHIKDSVNIPIDELEYRITHEVPKWPAVVLYCYYCPGCDAAAHPDGVESSCALAASELREAGYMHVRLLREDRSHLEKAGITIVADGTTQQHFSNGDR